MIWWVGILCLGLRAAPLAVAGTDPLVLTVAVLAFPDSTPIQGAAVFVRETGERSTSDATGRCTLRFRAPGTYVLLVHHIGYGDLERSVVVGDGTKDSSTFVLHASPFPTDEVVARSTKIGAQASAIPYPVDIQLSDHLASMRPVSVPDVVALNPGVALARDGSWETAVSIRGLRQSHIVSLIDGVRIESATDIAGVLSLMNLNDIERIETIKTSGSVLYGSGAVGGVVSVQTKKPAFSDRTEFRGEAVSGASTVDHGVSEYASVEAGSSDVAARISGGMRKSENTATPSGSLPNSQFHDFSLTGSLLVRTFGAQTLAFTYQRAQAEDAGIPGGSPFSMNATATYTLARRQLFSAEYRLPDPAPGVGAISILLSRQEIDRNVRVVQSPTMILTPHAVHTTNSAGVNAILSPGGGDILAVGIDVWQRSLESRREKENLTAMTLTGDRPVPASRFLSAGLYAQNEWQPRSSPVVFVTGARYDAIQVSNDNSWNPEYVTRISDGSSVMASQQLLWGASTARNASWSVNAGARVAVTAGIDVSAFIGSAYRSPSLEERFQYLDLGSVVQVGDPALRPERSVSTNVGLRVHDDRIIVRADGFVTFLHDLVATLPGAFEGRPALVNANIGSARLAGGEGAADIRVSERWGVSGSLSYVRGRDTRTQTNLTQIPPLFGRIEGQYDAAEFGRVTVATDWAATQNVPGPGEIRTPGHVRVDAEYSSKPVRLGDVALVVRAGIQNILNQDYRDFLSTLRGIVRSEPGRNVFLVLSASV